MNDDDKEKKRRKKKSNPYYGTSLEPLGSGDCGLSFRRCVHLNPTV